MSKQAFMEAFAPEMEVELLSPGIANVTDGEWVLLVQPGYCAHCREIDGGEGPCAHKDAMALAIRNHLKGLSLPFDKESDHIIARWRQALNELEAVG